MGARASTASASGSGSAASKITHPTTEITANTEQLTPLTKLRAALNAADPATSNLPTPSLSHVLL
jgi:hypothetical protein